MIRRFEFVAKTQFLWWFGEKKVYCCREPWLQEQNPKIFVHSYLQSDLYQVPCIYSLGKVRMHTTSFPHKIIIFLLVLSMLSLIYVYDLCLYFLVRIRTNKAVILCYCLTHIWRETVKYIYISIKIHGLLILTMDYIMFRPKVEMHWWIMSL